MLKHGKPEFTGNHFSGLVGGQIRVVDFQVILLIEKVVAGIQLVFYGDHRQSFSQFLYISLQTSDGVFLFSGAAGIAFITSILKSCSARLSSGQTEHYSPQIGIYSFFFRFCKYSTASSSATSRPLCTSVNVAAIGLSGVTPLPSSVYSFRRNESDFADRQIAAAF